MRFSAKVLSAALGASTAVLLLAACASGSRIVPSIPQADTSSQSRVATAGASLDGVAGFSRALAQSAHSGIGWFSRQATTGTALLFVSHVEPSGGNVLIYPQLGKNQAPIGAISDAVYTPNGLFVDRYGKLYVCNFNVRTITEYPKGKTTHSKTLDSKPYNPQYVAVGKDGTVYVSVFPSGTVLEYANGSTTPTSTLTWQSGGYAAGVAVDGNNNVYVPYTTGSGSSIVLHVLEFPPGSTQGKDLGIDVKEGVSSSIAIDHQGNLLLGDQINQTVWVFPPGATQPSHAITSLSIPYQIALNHRNTHLYAVDGGSAEVLEATYPGGKLINTITNGLGGSSSYAAGVATSPDGSP